MIKKLLSNPNFYVNLYLHMTMLLTFLSIFFFAYISKQSRNGFNNEINSNFSEQIKNIDLSSTKNLMKVGGLNNTINKDDLINLYSNQDSQVKQMNKSLMTTVILVVSFIWIGFIAFYFINCNGTIDFKHIVQENILTLIMIGIVEFLFFKYIAWNYIPVEPDYLPKVFHNILINKFN